MEAPSLGSTRQVDSRRAISNAYYGVFHGILTAAADEFVGVTQRSSDRYTLVYRSVDHSAVRELCSEVKKQRPSTRYARYMPAGGFGPDLQAVATAVIELQEKRIAADYDPSVRIGRSDAISAVATARSALRRFGATGDQQRKAFLTLVLFKPR